MKLISFISAGVFIFCSAFLMKQENSKQQSLYDTKWRLTKIHSDSGTEEVLIKTAFIKFHEKKKSAGGNGGCNTFGSTLSVTGNKMSISEIFSTQMYCEETSKTETSFFRLLEKANRFEIKDKALLLYHDKDLLLEFESE
ncbi:MAG: META domain-containing protein [Sphingobacteriales bacterium]|nr:META domain-containing protein [Sphingobacteriales bacterium]